MNERQSEARTDGMKTTIQTLGGVILPLALGLPAMSADCDLVIKNGRAIDPETMLDAKRWPS